MMSKNYGSAERIALDNAETGSNTSSSKSIPVGVTVYEASDVDAPPLAPGAPVESVNPLGHEVTLFSGVMLNIGRMLGSGIFSTPGVILNSVGSIGLMLTFWVLSPMFAYAGLHVFSELASMFPNRSGAEVVYLEQAYPRPKYLVPVSFAVVTVLLSFSATNSIVFAQYFMNIVGVSSTPFRQTIIALLVATFAVSVVALSTKWSLRAVNFITSIKVISHIFIAMTGLVVLLGLTEIKDPLANFHDIWEGSTSNGNALATALIKTHFSYVGYNNVFNVLAEVKSPDPVRTVRNAGTISLALVTFMFVLINLAYVAVVPKEEIKQSGQLIAALFFQRVFGASAAAKLLPAMVACSCLGNIIAVTVTQARVLREVARQGLLPYPDVFASTRPFGTPLAPVALKYLLTVIVILALPASDAFNFLLDLASYPSTIFTVLTAIAVWILRQRRAAAKLPPTAHRAWNLSVVVLLMSSLFTVIMPWVPPEKGRADVSFWYATYCVVGIGILLLCGLYYWIWIVLLPNWGGYEIVEEVVELKEGARLARLVRRYKSNDGVQNRSESPEEEPLLPHRS